LLTPNSDLFSHAESSAEPFLTVEDVMRANGKNFRGFDVILTNPPFAGELKEKHFLHSYSLHKAGRVLERDVLFLERCVQLLKPGGRLAIVLPHNKLGSQSWSFAREWLLQQMQVTAVVGLGRNSFLPHTHQKTSVLIGIKRLRPAQEIDAERIFFAVSERDGKDSRGHFRLREDIDKRHALWERADHDLEDILKAFHDFESRHDARQDSYGAHSG
jgi:type I restriction enzyme M protein